jgi:hypothetical protein
MVGASARTRYKLKFVMTADGKISGDVGISPWAAVKF